MIMGEDDDESHAKMIKELLTGGDYFGNLDNFAHSRVGRGDISGQTVTGLRGVCVKHTYVVQTLCYATHVVRCVKHVVRCVKHTYVVRASLMPPTRLVGWWASTY